ncbi:MAG: response regulator transcription factor [Elusimicrobia bacterium]|nr:response regulator transcription factor [Elusimicrobiota bacterium]
MTPLRSFLVASSDPGRVAGVARLLPAAEQNRVAPCRPEDLLAQTRATPPTAVFLDVDEGSGDPYGLCRRLRRALARWHCAILTFGASTKAQDVARALDAGADDHWPFPFNEPLCRAYLRSILRRLAAAPGIPARIARCGLLELDAASGEARLEGAPLVLRAKEFAVLFALVARAGAVVSRECLLEEVWGFDDYGNSRAIDFHVAQLRRKLGSRAEEIETVPGRGYRLRKPSNTNLT